MIVLSDCLAYMATMPESSIDAIVTDPPYGLSFMGKDWDYGIPGKPFWAEALRVAKPGAHLLAFGGTRTFHRLTCAIEDAGWEIRDCLGWIYGSGFPKSESVSLAIDKKACRLELEANLGRKPTKEELKGAWATFRDVVGDFPNDRPNSHGKNAIPVGSAGLGQGQKMTAPATDSAREWQGWGTALKPAWEPIILARKPLDGTVAANVQKWGTGAVNVDGCRVVTSDNLSGGAYAKTGTERNDGWGMQRAGAGEYRQPRGRWPANIIHDGSDEVVGLFPQTGPSNPAPRKRGSAAHEGGWRTGQEDTPMHGDSGSAARFFYCAKASSSEREAGLEGMPERAITINEPHNSKSLEERYQMKAKNHHPTVKPVALMRYLCRLITPPKGLILDPFCGSGTTGIAAKAEGFGFIGIDNNQEYCQIAEMRISGSNSLFN